MGSAPSKSIPQPQASSNDEKQPPTNSGLSHDLASLHITSPKSPSGSLSLDTVSSWEASALSDPKLQLARTILAHSDIRSALVSRSASIKDIHVFNNVVDFKTGPVTNQKSSGRCWIFATTNVMRYGIMKKLKLKEFELSQVRSDGGLRN
jgi:bleomycin hydrolase